MRNLVLQEVRDFKEKEHGLKDKEWDNFNFATTPDASDPAITTHVSEVDYESLSDADLLRFLLYLHMSWDSVIERRVKDTILENLAEKLGLDGEIVSMEYRGNETVFIDVNHPLKKELEEINASIDNYFEGDNDQHFSEEYYKDLKARRDEIREIINK